MDTTNPPLPAPIPKLEGQIQCTGEAEYTNDIAPIPGELFGAFVIAEKGNCQYTQINTDAAMVSIIYHALHLTA